MFETCTLLNAVNNLHSMSTKVYFADAIMQSGWHCVIPCPTVTTHI